MECRDLLEPLSAYAAGEADAGEIPRLEEHMAACPACRAAVARMRATDGMLARVEAQVPGDFREKLFARLEQEELIPRRRSLFAYSVRWLAVPAVAVAALAIFLLSSRESGVNVTKSPEAPARLAQRAPGAQIPAAESREVLPARPSALPSAPAPSSTASAPEAVPASKAARQTAAAAAGSELSPEDREIVAYLEVLENPTVFEGPGDIDEMEIFAVPKKGKG